VQRQQIAYITDKYIDILLRKEGCADSSATCVARVPWGVWYGYPWAAQDDRSLRITRGCKAATL